MALSISNYINNVTLGLDVCNPIKFRVCSSLFPLMRRRALRASSTELWFVPLCANANSYRRMRIEDFRICLVVASDKTVNIVDIIKEDSVEFVTTITLKGIGINRSKIAGSIRCFHIQWFRDVKG